MSSIEGNNWVQAFATSEAFLWVAFFFALIADDLNSLTSRRKFFIFTYNKKYKNINIRRTKYTSHNYERIMCFGNLYRKHS